MGRFSRTQRVAAFLFVPVLGIVLALAAGAIRNNGSSSGGSPSSTNSAINSPLPAKGAEETNGPASFIGHASNAVMFVEWTRAGQNVTGSLREAILKSGATGLESTDHAFTGVIDGKGITLTLHDALGESSAYVGEVKENGFTLTLPGQGSSLITIEFQPGGVSGYDEATKRLLISRYPSPCSLYVTGHNVHIAFEGQGSPEDCATFVQHSTSGTIWTTALQEGAADGEVVCELENHNHEKVLITDTGSQEYGKEACNQLAGEGWG